MDYLLDEIHRILRVPAAPTPTPPASAYMEEMMEDRVKLTISQDAAHDLVVIFDEDGSEILRIKDLAAARAIRDVLVLDAVRRGELT